MKYVIYYDRSWRTWVIFIEDSEGNQVGDAEYEPNKTLAVATGERMLEEAQHARTL